MKQLCEHFKIESNVNFDNEKLISNTMVHEDQWFIASNVKHPEMLYQQATKAKESYEKEGLWGMTSAFLSVIFTRLALNPQINNDKIKLSIQIFSCVTGEGSRV
jgi:hypothetical protein